VAVVYSQEERQLERRETLPGARFSESIRANDSFDGKQVEFEPKKSSSKTQKDCWRLKSLEEALGH
jgi:hypothetical protein